MKKISIIKCKKIVAYVKIFSTYNTIKMHFNYIIKDHCHYTGKVRGVAHSICNLRYETSKETPIVFHNGFTHDYHFIIKELAKKLTGKFERLEENTETFITFSVSFKKELDNGETITYKLKCIDNFRFVSSKLSKLVKCSSDRLRTDKCKDCKSKLDYMFVKYF